jgi:hypothetical protein
MTIIYLCCVVALLLSHFIVRLPFQSDNVHMYMCRNDYRVLSAGLLHWMGYIVFYSAPTLTLKNY